MKKFISYTLSFIIILLTFFVPASATSEGKVQSIDFLKVLEKTEFQYVERALYRDYELKWESHGFYGNLVEVTSDTTHIKYIYDNNGNRISKKVDGVITTYEYQDGKVKSENRPGAKITYLYPSSFDVRYSSAKPIGFIFNEQTFYYEFNSEGSVQKILNENSLPIIQYEYKGGNVVSISERISDNVWLDVTNCEFSIGQINRIRYLGYYYDSETGWYYCGRYLDPKENCFITGNLKPANLEGLLSVPNSVYLETISLLDECIQDPNFGAPINYSSGWYSPLNSVETLTRLIYAENSFVGKNNERKAIGWVVANRVFDTGPLFPNNIKSVCTAPYQFEPITGDINGTYNARNPYTSSSEWSNAMSIACIIQVCVNYSSTTYLSELLPKPAGITNQLYFVGLSYFKTHYQSGIGCLQYNFGSGYVNISQVTVVDRATNITTSYQINQISDPNYCNIFFNIA